MMVFNANFRFGGGGFIRPASIFGPEVKMTFLMLCMKCSVNAWIGCLFFMCKGGMISISSNMLITQLNVELA